MFFNKQIDIKRKIILKIMCQKQFYVSEVISHIRLVRNLPLWKQIAKKSKIINRNYFGKYLREKIVSREHGWYGNYLLAKCCQANNSTSLSSSVNDIL